jgi:hypothetical protein|tara:strand:- start:636 stop:1313 length:678 start_codon:yes stop_codon:yes gene_type:complete
MKLSDQTVSVLKNFANINSGIFFEEGKVIRTVAPTKAILAKANITEEIPRNFGIYDITKMLGSYSLFEYPEVEFEDKYIVIEDKKNKRNVKYWVCDPELIVRPPEGKEIALPSEDVNFVLGSDALDFTIKQASVLSLPEIGIIGNGADITISALDSQTNETSSEQVVGETDKNFKFVFKFENITKLMAKNYNVSLSKKGLSKFVSSDNVIEYFVAIELANSIYED